MNYTCDLEFITTKDRIELPGLFYKPKKKDEKIGIIYLHGLSSTFYKHRIKKLARHFTGRGVSFLSFATRGNTAVHWFKKFDKRKKKGYESKSFGTAFENFSDCVYDIEAMIRFLWERKYKKIFLVGHSTGANKAAYYVIKKRNLVLDGVILLAPVADYPVLKERLGIKFKKAVRAANKMVKKRKGDQLMPFELGAGFVSAKRFLSLATPNSEEDVFTYRDGQNRLAHFGKVKIPLMVVYGEYDESVRNFKAKELVDLFKEKSQNSKYFKGVVIKGANHGFSGKESLVASSITDFIKSC